MFLIYVIWNPFLWCIIVIEQTTFQEVIEIIIELFKQTICIEESTYKHIGTQLLEKKLIIIYKRASQWRWYQRRDYARGAPLKLKKKHLWIQRTECDEQVIRYCFGYYELLFCRAWSRDGIDKIPKKLQKFVLTIMFEFNFLRNEL